MPHVVDEINSQPECWSRAIALASEARAALPSAGERVAVVGCGTSYYMARAYAALREMAGQGETDAFSASELRNRFYQRIVLLTRSGTTTEILDVLHRLPAGTPTSVVTADARSPAARAADRAVVLDFADERSIVQTRFATSTLMLLRAHLGEDITGLVDEAAEAVAEPLPAGAAERVQFTFLGHGFALGVAEEAALKLREAAQAWTEAYPAMEYRHGPISVSGSKSAVWFFGPVEEELVDDAQGTGALVVRSDRDPVAELIRVQRLAVELALLRGLDPDRPRHLTRSVVLRAGGVGG